MKWIGFTVPFNPHRARPWVSRFHTPTKEVYSGLGRLYVEHPDFRRLYDSYHESLATFLAAAMQAYADREL